MVHAQKERKKDKDKDTTDSTAGVRQLIAYHPRANERGEEE